MEVIQARLDRRPADAPAAEPFKINLGLDPDEIDPKIIDATEREFGRLQQHFDERVKTIEQGQVSLRSASARAVEQDTQRQVLECGKVIDKFIADQGSDFAETFGSESMESMTPQSKGYDACQRLIKTAVSLSGGGLQEFLNSGPAALKKALRAEFPDEVKSSHRKQFTADLSKRTDSAAATPTQTSPDSKEDSEKALLEFADRTMPPDRRDESLEEIE